MEVFMKRKAFKIFALLFATALLLLLLGGCDGGESADDGRVKVLLAYGEGVRVTSDNPVYVERGGTATFNIQLDETYTFLNVSRGTYEGGVVTVSDVTKDTRVKFYAEDLGYSTTEDYRFYFNAEDKDTSTVNSASVVKGGTEITVSAREAYKIFLGWSLDKSTKNVDEMISVDREFTFRISPDMANENRVVRLYANYAETGVYYYNANGGEVKMDTKNTADNAYYKLTSASEGLKVSMSGDYLGVFPSVHLFYDDGTFQRDGYVLVEYNTKPDGSGEGYSLGSQYYVSSADGSTNTLYCIWRKAESEESFTYVDFSYPLPVSAAKAPHWNAEGVMITSYLGDSECVTVPERIGGKAVTGIAGGAFKNKSLKELALPKTMLKIEDGAFVGCSSLEKIYYPDAIYSISDAAFDEVSLASLKSLYVNAVMAPRYSATDTGAMTVKLSRLLAYSDTPRIIVIAGSSAYQGLSSEYMEALFGGEYAVINFGTTRTTNGMIYLEAMGALADGDDTVLFAPENSTYMMGECELYWKTLRDLEGMYNFYRYIDISAYENVFTAFSDFNQNYRYGRGVSRYEAAYDRITVNKTVNRFGEYQNAKRTGVMSGEGYIDAYFITLNERYKSKYEGQWDDKENQQMNNDYTDKTNKTWASIDEEPLLSSMNRAIAAAKSGGAKVYFSFCPVDADKLVPAARTSLWMAEYDKLIDTAFDFDGRIGRCEDYVFAHKYFYDCAFHPNDIGRTYRTYRLYLDLCETFGISPEEFLSQGTDFEGCIFEGESGIPDPLTFS